MKMKNFRRVAALGMAVGMTAVLAACGNTADTASSEAAESTAETADTAEKASAETADAEYAYLADFSFSDAFDENGYLKGVTAADYVTLPDDYADITISADLGQVSDDDINDYIDSNVLSNFATTNEVKDRAAADGDTVNIDYVGRIDGVAFDGGDTKGSGADLTLGSGTYIDNFEDQIVGHTPGETFDVTVTFPENYGNDALAGKEAVFTMTLNAIYETGITDEMVAAYEGNDYATVTEWENAVWNELMTDAVWSLIPALADFRDETDAYRYYYQDMLDVYHYYAASYGMQFERFLSFYGLTVSALEAKSRETARSYLLAAAVVRALDLTPEADWLSRFETAYIADYVASGYTEAQVRERIASGEGRLAYRAAMLSELAAERLVASNTFTD